MDLLVELQVGGLHVAQAASCENFEQELVVKFVEVWFGWFARFLSVKNTVDNSYN